MVRARVSLRSAPKNCPTGKSPKTCLALVAKNIPLWHVRGQISGSSPRVSPDERGGSRRSSRNARWDAWWTQMLRLTSAADADGEVVWS